MTNKFLFLIMGFSLNLVVGLSHSAQARQKSRPPSELRGVVQSCHDGDTCRIKIGGEVAKVRFSGIDTPEIKQGFGVEAKAFTENHLKGQEVALVCDGKSFDRLTCTVLLKGADFNAQIVQAGWAFDSGKYSKGKYRAAMEEAKKNRRGIWKDGFALSPYCFRSKNSKHCKVSQSYMP